MKIHNFFFIKSAIFCYYFTMNAKRECTFYTPKKCFKHGRHWHISISIGSPLEQKSEVKIYEWGGGFCPPHLPASHLTKHLYYVLAWEPRFAWKWNFLYMKQIKSAWNFNTKIIFLWFYIWVPSKKNEGKSDKGFMSSDRKYNQINKHRILLYIFNNVLGKQLYLLWH